MLAKRDGKQLMNEQMIGRGIKQSTMGQGTVGQSERDMYIYVCM